MFKVENLCVLSMHNLAYSLTFKPVSLIKREYFIHTTTLMKCPELSLTNTTHTNTTAHALGPRVRGQALLVAEGGEAM